ncbi:MAG: hypothetical protein JW855_03120 [Gammaproteobacteria bacterium]|nr:hypothetical protein [Gammaproteobacteria bacterium]
MQIKPDQFFQQWLETSLGQAVLSEEQKALREFWEKNSGDYCLMLGNIPQLPLITQSSHKKKFLIVENEKIFLERKKFDFKELKLIVGRYIELPIAPKSMHTVLLPHTLDLAPTQTNRILKEAQLLLHPKSYVVIIGINPVSLWGLKFLISKIFNKKQKEWGEKLYFPYQLKKRLKLFNLRVVKHKRLLYRPPTQNKKLFQYLKFLEFLGKNFFFLFNGIYILVAQRSTIVLTPLQMKWEKIPQIIQNALAQPATKGATQHFLLKLINRRKRRSTTHTNRSYSYMEPVPKTLFFGDNLNKTSLVLI